MTLALSASYEKKMVSDIQTSIDKLKARRIRCCEDFTRKCSRSPSSLDSANFALELAKIDGAIEALEALI